MINLMPDQAKAQLRAARVNVMLARYIVVIFLAFAFLILLLAGSYIVLTQTKASAERLKDDNTSKTEVYSTTKAQVEALSASLSQAKTILDQEVLYSNVLMNIGQQMPEGTVIESITLDSTSFTGAAIKLKAFAKTTDEAVALREKFQTSPIFSGVNFESVSDADGIPGYPVSVSMTLTITKEASK